MEKTPIIRRKPPVLPSIRSSVDSMPLSMTPPPMAPPRSNNPARKRPVPWYSGDFMEAVFPMSGSGDRIYRVWTGTDRNMSKPKWRVSSVILSEIHGILLQESSSWASSSPVLTPPQPATIIVTAPPSAPTVVPPTTASTSFALVNSAVSLPGLQLPTIHSLPPLTTAAASAQDSSSSPDRLTSQVDDVSKLSQVVRQMTITTQMLRSDDVRVCSINKENEPVWLTGLRKDHRDFLATADFELKEISDSIDNMQDQYALAENMIKTADIDTQRWTQKQEQLNEQQKLINYQKNLVNENIVLAMEHKQEGESMRQACKIQSARMREKFEETKKFRAETNEIFLDLIERRIQEHGLNNLCRGASSKKAVVKRLQKAVGH
ncbi:unnamed protein product [Adineta ricciae]|uniref:Uncharacterized protein n=1 Tax=Adineta ricciae TaxID=249248 RepID=A0A813UV04_ADIRI|nr:unnamed protein product [Adineta ricciae]